MTCKEILLNHFKKNGGEWQKKVHLYAVAEDYSPETVGRELRYMEEEKILDVGKYDGKYTKGLAKYRLAQPVKKIYYKLEDGRTIEKII